MRKNLIIGILAHLSIAGLSVASAEAAVKFDTDVSGQLTGAKNISVNGLRFDVTFLDGSCSGLFSGCDQDTDFTFQTETDALSAATALLDQVFQDVSEGLFDTDPELIRGCFSTQDCATIIPFAIIEPDSYQLVVANNVGATFPDLTFSTTAGRAQDFTFPDRVNFARFSPAAAVSEPLSLLVFSFGLFAIAAFKRLGRIW